MAPYQGDRRSRASVRRFPCRLAWWVRGPHHQHPPDPDPGIARQGGSFRAPRTPTRLQMVATPVSSESTWVAWASTPFRKSQGVPRGMGRAAGRYSGRCPCHPRLGAEVGIDQITHRVRQAHADGRSPLPAVAEGFVSEHMGAAYSERGLDTLGRPGPGGIADQPASEMEARIGI